MLTHNDVTVKDAYDIFEECKDIERTALGIQKCRSSKDEMETDRRCNEGCQEKQHIWKLLPMMKRILSGSSKDLYQMWV